MIEDLIVLLKEQIDVLEREQSKLNALPTHMDVSRAYQVLRPHFKNGEVQVGVEWKEYHKEADKPQVTFQFWDGKQHYHAKSLELLVQVVLDGRKQPPGLDALCDALPISVPASMVPTFPLD